MIMREIKFRAWDKGFQGEKGNKMITHDFLPMQGKNNKIAFNKGDNNFKEVRDYDRYVVMQYTGLKDKNGKGVYEGDIVSWWGGKMVNGTGKNKECREEVIYDSELTRFKSKKTGIALALDSFEVIGNIYENPELMETNKCPCDDPSCKKQGEENEIGHVEGCPCSTCHNHYSKVSK